MRDYAIAGQTGLYRWSHRDCVLAGIDFPVAVGQRLEIVGFQGCAVSKNAAPQNSSLVEEISGSWVWVEIQGKVRVAARIQKIS